MPEYCREQVTKRIMENRDILVAGRFILCSCLRLQLDECLRHAPILVNNAIRPAHHVGKLLCVPGKFRHYSLVRFCCERHHCRPVKLGNSHRTSVGLAVGAFVAIHVQRPFLEYPAGENILSFNGHQIDLFQRFFGICKQAIGLAQACPIQGVTN